MIRTKLGPKRVRIRQRPPREPYTKFKIKTLLPEQKTAQIKENGQVKNSHCQKKNSKVHRSLGKNILKKMKGLRPNWSDHDAATCPIINYFADRQNKEITLTKQENLITETCSYCKERKNCFKLKAYRGKFKKKGFWTFNKNVRIWNVFDPDWSIKNR